MSRPALSIVPSKSVKSSSENGLGTSLDVQLETSPRVAGVEKGRLHNSWLNCTYSINVKHANGKSMRGFSWKAAFVAKDCPRHYGPSDLYLGLPMTFSGTSTTREVARGAAIDSLTKHMFVVSKAREEQAAAEALRVRHPVVRWFLRLRTRIVGLFRRSHA